MKLGFKIACWIIGFMSSVMWACFGISFIINNEFDVLNKCFFGIAFASIAVFFIMYIVMVLKEDKEKDDYTNYSIRKLREKLNQTGLVNLSASEAEKLAQDVFDCKIESVLRELNGCNAWYEFRKGDFVLTIGYFYDKSKGPAGILRKDEKFICSVNFESFQGEL